MLVVAHEDTLSQQGRIGIYLLLRVRAMSLAILVVLRLTVGWRGRVLLLLAVAAVALLLLMRSIIAVALATVVVVARHGDYLVEIVGVRGAKAGRELSCCKLCLCLWRGRGGRETGGWSTAFGGSHAPLTATRLRRSAKARPCPEEPTWVPSRLS